MDQRRLIIGWIKTHGGKSHWLLDVYYHLITSGATPDEASDALEQFVDDICAMKTAKQSETVK
jgi:hypothetical protein